MASTVTLSGQAAFKGFLAKQPASGGVLSAPTVGAAFSTCGFGHTNAQSKNSVNFTFTPTASTTASTVTLTGFVVQNQATWFTVSTTLPVAAGSTPGPVPVQPQTPPSGALAARPRLAAVAAAAGLAAAAACAA